MLCPFKVGEFRRLYAGAERHDSEAMKRGRGANDVELHGMLCTFETGPCTCNARQVMTTRTQRARRDPH